MKGIENIIERILADAAARQEEILGAARAEAEGIAARYAEQAKQRGAQLRAEGEAQAAQAEQRLLAAAELEARKELLAHKQHLIDTAFEEALQQLQAQPAAEQEALLTRLIVAASASGAGEILFSPGIAGDSVIKAANAALKQAGKAGTLQPAAAPREIGFGFVIKEGDTELNCVLEKLIWDAREALAIELAAVLFPAS